VKTAVIGFQQSRVRYENAVNTRVLAQQTLVAEQNRFNLGATPDTTLLIQAQDNLSLTQSAEVQAMANYSHARIALDEAVGQTLDVNHISMVEAEAGRVERPSAIPDSVPAGQGRAR
jgi:outer membrane protein TolC